MKIIRLLIAWLPITVSLAACNPSIYPEPIATSTRKAVTIPTYTDFPPRSIEDITPSIASPTREITSTSTPTIAVPAPRSVMVICWDAGQAALVYQAMADGWLPHFQALADQGMRAEYVQTVDPSLSAPAQNSLTTGALPEKTGIVSNAFHNPNDSFYWYRQGFDEPLDQAQPVWVTASEAGLKSAALFIAGATPELPGQMADYTIGYGIRDAYSRQVKVSISPAQAWENAPISYSQTLAGSFFIPEITKIELLVIDTLDDQVVNYDTVLLSPTPVPRSTVINPPLRLEVDEWGSLVLLPNIMSGADFLLQEVTQTQVSLYHSSVNHNTAAPRSLLANLNEQFSFFPAAPDKYALENGWISADDYLEMLERSASWMAQVTAWVADTYQPELLYTWQDGFDSTAHAFLLTDIRQPGYQNEQVAKYASYLQRSAWIADNALEIMLQSQDLNETAVILTADHGITPVHTTVFVNTILEDAGLLKLNSRDYVVVDRTKALAVASGGSVHIYINQFDQERDGVISEADSFQVQAQIIALLQGVVDPVNGQPVFQRILGKGELGQAGLDHLVSGDIFAQAALGYHLDDTRGSKTVFAPADILGDHGYDSNLPDMHVFFIAAGAGIRTSGQTTPGLKIIDIPPTIAALLGFETASWVDGVAARAILAR